MKWDGATTAFRTTTFAISSGYSYCKIVRHPQTMVSKRFFNTCSSMRYITTCDETYRCSRTMSKSMMMSRGINSSRMFPSIVLKHPMSTTTTISKSNGENRNDDTIIYNEIGKQELADPSSSSSSSSFSVDVTSWADSYIHNAITAKRYTITEESLSALQILIRSCDSPSTKNNLDLVLRFLLPTTTTSSNLTSTTSQQQQQDSTIPNHWDIILKEIANIATNVSTAPHYAQTILDYMEKNSGDDFGSGLIATPTTTTYNYVLQAWKNTYTTATTNTTSTKNNNNIVVLRAQAIYDRMVARNIQPNNSTLTLMIHLWATSNRSDAAFHATGHLLTLEKEYLKQEKEISDITTTNSDTTGQLPANNEHEGTERALPQNVDENNSNVNSQLKSTNMQRDFYISVREYEAVLHAWAVSTRKASTKRATTILHKMKQWHTSGILPFEPSMECYKAVLTSWKTSEGKVRYEAAEQAAEIISYMLQRYDDGKQKRQVADLLVPDSECFSIALSIMSYSSKRGMAETSQYFLQRMEQLAATSAATYTGNISPSISTIVKKPTWVNYTDVIKAFALSKDVNKTVNAEKVLLRMEQLYDEFGNASLRPHVQSYIAAISAHIKSNAPDKAKQALFILQHMDERNRTNASNPKPTTECYNTVLRACARPSKDADMSDKQAALRIALGIMKALMKTPTNNSNPSSVHLTCNEESYELLLKCCSKLLPVTTSGDNKERDEAIRLIFKQACRYGYVNENVLKELHASAGKVMYKRLVGAEYTIDAITSIPQSWSRNSKATEATQQEVSSKNSRGVERGRSRALPSSDTLLYRKNRKLLQGGRLS